MVYTKKNFKSPCESNFPPVDIEQDASLTIGEILYNVAHGLPTGLRDAILEFDEEDSEPSQTFEDKFDMIDSVIDSFEQNNGTNDQISVDGAPSGTSTAPAVESEANPESEANTAGG